MEDQPYAVHDRIGLAQKTYVPLVVRRRATMRQAACWIAVRHLLEVMGEHIDPVTVARELPSIHRNTGASVLAELVELGLLRHLGTTEVAGKRNLRNLYMIPHEYLVSESLRIAQDELAASGRRYLTSVVPDPTQFALDLELGVPPVPARPLTEIPDVAINDMIGRVVETCMPLVVRRRVTLYPQMCWLAMSAMIDRGDTSVGARAVAVELATRSYPRVADWIETLVSAGLVAVVGSEHLSPVADRRIFAVPWNRLLSESLDIARVELEVAGRRYYTSRGFPSVIPSGNDDPIGSQGTPPLVIPSGNDGPIGSQGTPPLVIPSGNDGPIGSQGDDTFVQESSPNDEITHFLVIPSGNERPIRSRVGESESRGEIYERERVSERAHTLFFEHLIQTAPPAPPAALFAAHSDWIWRGDLCAHPLAMWQLAAHAPSALDRDVFFALASAHDDATGGYGWYWIGQAILMIAATGKKIQAPQLVVVMLTAWKHRDAYGAESEAYRAKVAQRAASTDLDSITPAAVNPAQTGAGASYAQERVVVPPAPLEPLSAPLSVSDSTHPAVAAYIAIFGRTPNAEQTRRIIETVTDLPTWQTVLGEWQANDWKPGSVVGMLDRYGKNAPATAPNGDPLTPLPIYIHPGLSDDVRSDWMGRWHATPKNERAALLARLEREHPIEPQKQETP